MKKLNEKLNVAALLRQKAEEKLNRQQTKTSLSFSQTNYLKLAHELQIHQIELEMQNEELILAKQKAEINSQKYTELYDFATSGYITLSKNGEIVELNYRAANMLGKNRSNLINSSFGFFISEETRIVFNQFFQKLIQSKTTGTCEVELTAEGNAPNYVQIDGLVSQNMEQCLLTMIDITERKKAAILQKKNEEFFLAKVKAEISEKIAAEFLNELTKEKEKTEESEEKYRLFHENAGVGIGYYSPEGVVISYNSLAASHMDGIPSDFAGKSIFDLFTKQSAEIYFERIKKAVLSEKPKVYEDFVKLPNEEKWFLSTFTKIAKSTKSVLGIQIISHDITKLKKTEIELITAKALAEDSDRLKSAFLANMSHEIRTPMNGILGFSALLKNPSLTGDQQQEYIRIIEKSGIRMLNIINDIVDISKIEAGQMKVDLEYTNINKMIEYIYKFFKPEAEGKSILFSCKNGLPSEKAIVKTDREKVFAILTNLVKNAIKYTNSGSLEFGYNLKSNKEPAELEFFIKDTGIGIPQDRLEAIFERFVQADISDKKALQGAGLGLTISKAYVEMLGGKIWVESEVGKGSIFYFTLPYNIEQEGEIATENFAQFKEIVENAENLKILIAEDDETSEMLISLTIKKFSKEIIKARTGNAAVEICRNNPDIDLIFMDIQMPDLNGYEATKQIRQFNQKVVIIAQTAFGLTGDREKAIKAGCNDYISKPILKEELLTLIYKYFGK
jgi:hypothetical protein